jgi:hypothetical protein
MANITPWVNLMKDPGTTMFADGKYTKGEMENPEHLKRSVDDLAKYTKKNKMNYP